MNNINLCAFADESSPMIDGQIQSLNKNNIKYLEIRNVDGENISKISADTAKSVIQKLNAHNLDVWSIGSPFGKIDIKDDFAPHLDCFKYCLENAVILKAKCIRLFSFFTYEYSSSVRDAVFERLDTFCDVAKGYDIVLCHENEKGIYGDTPERCLEIFENLPKIKGIFDPANFVQCNVDIKSAWDMLKKHIYYMHIKDATADGVIVPAGKGIGEIPFLTREFSNMGGGIMTLEPHLKTFDGLAALEGNEKTNIDDFTYNSNEEAFDAAVTAMNNILKTI